MAKKADDEKRVENRGSAVPTAYGNDPQQVENANGVGLAEIANGTELALNVEEVKPIETIKVAEPIENVEDDELNENDAGLTGKGKRVRSNKKSKGCGPLEEPIIAGLAGKAKGTELAVNLEDAEPIEPDENAKGTKLAVNVDEAEPIEPDENAKGTESDKKAKRVRTNRKTKGTEPLEESKGVGLVGKTEE